MWITISNRKWERSLRNYKLNHLIQEISYHLQNPSTSCLRLKLAPQLTWSDIFALKQLKECLSISINYLSSTEEGFLLLLHKLDLVLEIRSRLEMDLSELDNSKWQRQNTSLTHKIKNIRNSNTLPILSYPYIALNISKI